MFISSTLTLYRQYYPKTIMNIEVPTLSLLSKLVKKKKNTINLQDIYSNAYETTNFSVNDEGCFISFTHHFKYRRSIINFLLDNTTDINIRISIANKVMGAMGFIQDMEEVLIETQYKLHIAISVNFAMWNSETWVGNSTNLHRLDTFHHKVIC